MDGRAFLRRVCLASWVWVLAAAAQLADPVTVGRLADHQGVVGVRPVNGERWTPVTEELPLAPGDWVRTDVRGPNAVLVRLPNGGSVILGPGTLAEVVNATTLRVARGELEVTADKANPVTVGLPPERAEGVLQPVVCTAATVLRVRDGAIERLEREPSWLQGFRGTVVKESMGELLVTVDGRDVPLTIGYHKVTVDIRDQIARTVIEESFVNHTSSQLEGVFHFPLPADASISDFGMWIGDELVQADVVEKQRAREIYETILRERRDPGLLEWAGGNLFKARVFPIFPQAEKRVTITYTQVLPMRDGSYRYAYPLASEMLRQKPLRELQLMVNLVSTAPLTSVRCVSHPARIRQSANAARIEFAAQEVVPSRDFELVVEPDAGRQPLSAVPHQRGSDGYFLLLLNPPSERAGRRLLGGGEPLRLIVLADTSGSMDAAQRAVQAELLRALLASLGRRDRFLLAACDVECSWLTDGFQAPGDNEVEKAVDALAHRGSLGWSDLERAFASAAAMAAKADGPCQILYLGDGVPATAETDPTAFAKQLPELLKDAVAKGASCHAIATGSTYETVVLKALAAQGAGSFRRIEGDGGPVKAARELLEELTRAPVRHLAIEFKGLRAARVYPEELPNLSAGSQQVIVGRYQPASLAADATVRITGRLGEKDVAFEQPLRLPAGDEGNSFIPRLWARHHLDYLLAQGTAPAVREEIVAFSQEYRIMTPYTSFLVLESDADRERFGVRRHIAMRDGEAFFAAGRAQGSFQLAQQQMQQAAAWRAGLRRQILALIAQLGREAAWAQAPGGMGMPGGMGGVMLDHLGGDYRPAPAAIPARGAVRYYDSGLNGAAMPMDMAMDADGLLSADSDLALGAKARFAESWMDAAGERSAREALGKAEAVAGEEAAGVPLPAAVPLMSELLERPPADARMKRLAFVGEPTAMSTFAPAMPAAGKPAMPWAWAGGGAYGVPEVSRFRARASSPRAVYDDRGDWGGRGDPEQWLSQWTTPPPMGQSPDRRPPRRPDAWSEEAFRLSSALDRRPALAAATAPVRVLSTTYTYEPQRQDRLAHVRTHLAIRGPDRWLTLSAADRDLPRLTWSTPEQDGLITLPHGLGRVRRRDNEPIPPVCPLSLDDYSTSLLHESFRGYRCRLEPKGRDRAELIIESARPGDFGFRILVDTARHVAIEQQNLSLGKLTSRREFSRFREVGGMWWATRVTVYDGDGKVTGRTELEVDTPAAEDVARAWDLVERAKADAVLIPVPLPELLAAKRASAAGTATVGQRLRLIMHAAATQRWERAQPQLEALRRELSAKPGWRHLEMGFLAISRRHEEMRATLLALTRDFVVNGLPPQPCLGLLPRDRAPESGGELALVEALRRLLHLLQANERLDWLDSVKPIYDRQPERLEADARWLEQRAEVLRQAGQPDTALAVEADSVRRWPWDASALARYARNLAATGEYERAATLLERALANPHPSWQVYQLSQLRDALLGTMEQAGWGERQVALLASFASGEANDIGGNYCTRYLEALLRADREAEADTVAAAWTEALLATRGARTALTRASLARARAAARYMVGNLPNSSSPWFNEKWLPALEQVVRRAAGDPQALDIAQTVMGNPRFADTDACRGLRAEFTAILLGDLAAVDSARVRAFLGWIEVNDPPVETDTWRSIATNLEKRWTAEAAALHGTAPDDPQRPIPAQVHEWGALTANVCRGHLGPAEYLRFCRRQYVLAVPAEGTPVAELPSTGLAAYRDAYAQEWFGACLAHPWDPDVEDEAFRVILKLAGDAEEPERILTQARALAALADAMVAGRQAAIVAAHTGAVPASPQTVGDVLSSLLPAQRDRLKPIPTKPLQQLTRTERRDLQTVALALGRETTATHLAELGEGFPETLRSWVAVERLGLLARPASASDGMPAVSEMAAEVLEWLGPRPPVRFASPAEEALLLRQLALAEFLVVREALPAATAAKRPAELPPTAAALVTYMRAGTALPDGGAQAFWRGRLYRLLVALDRPAEIETELRAWVAAEDVFGPWHVPLAYLLAETDRLPDAVARLEAVAKEDELGPAEYRALAEWHTALGNRDAQRTAELGELDATDENELRRRLEQTRNGLRQRRERTPSAVPEELDPVTVDVLTVLLRKTEQPASHLWLAREFYTSTRDFRLLRCLAEGAVGHTTEQVYPLLQGFRDLLQEVQDEATLDELAAALGDVRRRALTAVDRRALLLLEAEVRRRASEVLNQPAQHAPAALAALQAASREIWSPGEPRLMASYLAALGRITPAELAQEQLRQLEDLLRLPDGTAVDRLEVAHAYGRTLGAYARNDNATDVLTGALDEVRRPQGGRLNSIANSAVDTLIGLWERQGHFTQGETWLRRELERSANDAQREWFEKRLFQLYENAVRQNGETALGRGQEQYAAVRRELIAELAKPGRAQHLQTLVSRCVGVARAARDRQLNGVGEDLWAFASEVVPGVLRRQSREPYAYQDTVTQVAEALHTLASPREALAFLITCAEAEPAWFRFDYRSFWQQQGWRVAQWRSEVKDLGALEARLLAIVLRELRLDLEQRQQRQRTIYARGHPCFWTEKAGDFARTAEEVYAQRRNSGAAVDYIAQYLFWGLELRDRAIAMLQDAWQRELLDEGGQFRLVTFLHRCERYAESVPVIDKLVTWRPDHPGYRGRHVVAYAKSGRPAEAEKARAEAEKHLKEKDLWDEQASAALALGCLDGGLYPAAVTYYDETIALHRRTTRPTAQGDAELSQYYANLAQAHAGAGDTLSAVDAAAGAVVSWGRNRASRNQAIGALVQVLRHAKDLDGTVAALDKKAAETRLDSPIVRKALGQVYAEQKAHEKAVAQFRLALAGQPNDEETHRALVASCDALRWPEEAVLQLLALSELLPRDVRLRRDLYERLRAMGKADEAERATTAIVEAAPAEAESHQAMATLRQEQDRWPEAMPHWRRVAELRALEPTGLLGLAAAQLHLGHAVDAKASLDRLLATSWPERFGDVHAQARDLRRRLEQ